MVETEVDGAWVVVDELLVELLFVDELEWPVLDDELEPFEFDDELELPVLDDELEPPVPDDEFELPVLDDELEIPVLYDASELLPTVTPSAWAATPKVVIPKISAVPAINFSFFKRLVLSLLVNFS